AIHAGLQVDVMRTTHLAGILVLDIGRGLQRIGRTAHAALGRRGFSFGYGHGTSSILPALAARWAETRARTFMKVACLYTRRAAFASAGRDFFGRTPARGRFAYFRHPL